MKDKLTEFLEKHKGNMLVEEPPKNHELRFLDKLEATDLKSSKKNHRPLYWSIAASVVILFSIAWVWNNIQPTTSEESIEIVESYKPEALMEAENEISNQVASTKEELLSQSAPNNASVQHTLIELKRLEGEYKNLENDLIMTGNENVIEAMHQNLELRMKILEKTQKHIGKK